MERALSDVTTLNDSGFTSNLRKEISDLLLENRHPGTSAIGVLLIVLEDFEVLTCGIVSNH